MNESKALLGLPSEFTLAGVKVKVYQPNVEWVLKALGLLDKLGPALKELVGGKGVKGMTPLLSLIFSTIKLPWYKLAPVTALKFLWFRRLNVAQQTYFLEKWMEAVDVPGMKDCFQRAGKAISGQLISRDTP